MYIMNFNIFSKATKMTTSGASLMLVYNIRINACMCISKKFFVVFFFSVLKMKFTCQVQILSESVYSLSVPNE